MNKTSSSRLLTILQVSERLQLSRSTIYSLMDRGLLRSVKIGAVRRIYEGDLDKYIHELVADGS